MGAADFAGDLKAEVLSGTTNGTAKYKLVDALTATGLINPPALNGIDVTPPNAEGVVYVGS